MSKRSMIQIGEGFALYMAVALGFPQASRVRVFVVVLVVITVGVVAQLWKDRTYGN